MEDTQRSLRYPYSSHAFLRDPAFCYAAAMQGVAIRIRTLDAASEEAFGHWMRAVARLMVATETNGSLFGPPHASVQSLTFYQTDRWRLGLLRLGKGAVIPLHDHPASFAISLLLGGGLNVKAYELVDGSAARSCRLRPAWEKEFSAGGLVIMEPWQINLHRFSAGHRGAVLMTAVVSTTADLAERNWYVNLREVGAGMLSAVKMRDAELQTLQRLKREREERIGSPVHPT